MYILQHIIQYSTVVAVFYTKYDRVSEVEADAFIKEKITQIKNWKHDIINVQYEKKLDLFMFFNFMFFFFDFVS